MRVFCARSMHIAVGYLAHRFAGAASGVPDIVFEPMGALNARIDAGETADVLILAAPALEKFESSGALIGGSRTVIAHAPIGVAIGACAPVPDVTTADAFVATLKTARAIALSAPAVGGSAGVYLRDLFARIGLADAIAAKATYRKSGVAAADAVGRGEADLALSFIPELLQGRDVHILGPLPAPYGHTTTYAAGVSSQSHHTDLARAFIAALTAPDAVDVWAVAGFDLASS